MSKRSKKAKKGGAGIVASLALQAQADRAACPHKVGANHSDDGKDLQVQKRLAETLWETRPPGSEIPPSETIILASSQPCHKTIMAMPCNNPLLENISGNRRWMCRQGTSSTEAQR